MCRKRKEINPDNIQILNELIAGLPSGVSGGVSDGYHTFDELYEYRKLYNAALFNEWARLGLYDVHKSTRHSDSEECFGGGWFIVVATTPAGQISNHYKMEDFHLFAIPDRVKADEWDGHTPQQAAERLRRHLAQVYRLSQVPNITQLAGSE